MKYKKVTITMTDGEHSVDVINNDLQGALNTLNENIKKDYSLKNKKINLEEIEKELLFNRIKNR